MDSITTLFDRTSAPAASLPPALAAAYDGGLVLPERAPGSRPYVLANFVETLDGVVSYAMPGHSGGGPISGESEPDHLVMGLLRAVAGAVIFGTGSLHEDSGHVRTPAFIYPPMSGAYAELRWRLGLGPEPLSVVVSGSGRVDLSEPTFSQPGLHALIATTAGGAKRLADATLPERTTVRALPATSSGAVDLAALLALLGEDYGVRVALTEGGPRLFASFLAAGLVDELFLTLAPQVAGRAGDVARLALVEGLAHTPETAPWAELLSVKRAASHLLLRYRFIR